MIIDTICVSCEIFDHVNDLGLCADCNTKYDRDLIRARDWDYSPTACFLPDEQREALREQIIREYESKNEIITDEKPRKRKNTRMKSRTTQRKREIAANAIRDYDIDDVLHFAYDYLRELDDEWVNFSKFSQHLYERFYNLKPKRLGKTSKKYKSLLKFLLDYPSLFVIREDDQKRGVYWIQLA